TPVEEAKKTPAHLKKEKKCDYVICLSHLGYSYPGKKVSNEVLPAEISEIDLIIGGQTHTFLEEPQVNTNSLRKSVYVTQVGWAGILLGRVDIFFGADNHKQTSVASVVNINGDIG